MTRLALHALAELFPGRSIEEIVTDLLHAALDEIAAAMPYEPGPKIISRDDHGDPVYEDIGLTPRFVELTRKFKKDWKPRTPMRRNQIFRPGAAPRPKLDAARSGRRYSSDMSAQATGSWPAGGGAPPRRSGRWALKS